MLRRSVLAVLVLALLLLLLPSGQLLSQAVREVFVTNFPKLQTVRGAVAIDGPVELARMVRLEEITLPPIGREETTRLLEAGTIEAEGFPSLVLSLQGVVKGHVGRVGTVGVILIPDESRIQEAFDEHGMMHFYMEARAQGVSADTPYFASEQPSYTVAFPRYKVLLYNTTDKAVTVDVFAYLTN
jgi:hypothetical protein